MSKVLEDATPGGGLQYQSAVWTENPEQAAVARRVAAEMRKDRVPIFSTATTKWTDAESYHRALLTASNHRASIRCCLSSHT